MPGNTKYKKSWEKIYDWVKPCPRDQYYAKCLACGDRHNISSGVSILKSHEIRNKHDDNYRTWKKQSTFATGSDGKIALELPGTASTSKVLSTEEQALKANIIRCLDIVHTNSPFSAGDEDNDKYRRMFPDSEVAKNYKQHSDKVKYVTQFGIAPILRNIILADLKDKPFSFRFDETTTCQIKKQYDAYATYFSDHFNAIVTNYLGTLFVGKCTAEDLLHDLNIMMEKLNLNIDYLTSLGMDGPNVNKSFYGLLSDVLKTKNKTLIDAGTCSLHTVANAFGKGLAVFCKEHDLDLNEFCINLHSFFKLSAKRIEQYFTCDILTELEPQRMIRHAETRWLGIQRILLRIMEQLSNIKAYFLKILPVDKKSFNGSKGVGCSKRYLSIKKVISDERLIAVISGVVYIAQEFKSYVVPLQSKSPLITVLFTKMQNLLQSVLSMFLNENVYMKSKKLKTIASLVELDLTDSKKHKAKCELGAKFAKEVKVLKPLEQKKVNDMMREFLITVAKYLLENLPLDKQVIRDARYFNPHWPLDNDRSSAAVGRLGSAVWDSLDKKMIGLFKLKPLAIKYDFLDIIQKEFASFRLETPENEKNTTCDAKKSISKPSYWRKCYELAGLDQQVDDDGADGHQVDAESYWMKVMGIKDEDGKLKFWHLGMLALCVLTIPHGNADPERGFSINKKMLEKHGSNLGEDTLEALRVIKDYMIQIGGPDKVLINRAMLDSCAASHGSYEKYKAATAAEDLIAKKKKEEQKVADDAQKASVADDTRIKVLEHKIILSDAMIAEGNKLLKACVNKMVLSLFKEGQEKVEIGVKRKSELNEELAKLRKKSK